MRDHNMSRRRNYGTNPKARRRHLSLSGGGKRGAEPPTLPLEGIRVLDFSLQLPGPLAAVMQDLGIDRFQ